MARERISKRNWKNTLATILVTAIGFGGLGFTSAQELNCDCGKIEEHYKILCDKYNEVYSEYNERKEELINLEKELKDYKGLPEDRQKKLATIEIKSIVFNALTIDFINSCHNKELLESIVDFCGCNESILENEFKPTDSQLIPFYHVSF